MRYGWIPDVPDHRDFLMTRPTLVLPDTVDLRLHCPPVYDQGALGSCTANAIAAAIEYERSRQGLPDFMPSRLFIYYNERKMEGTINSDSGAMIRDGIKSVAQIGACPESGWGYDISKFTVLPDSACYAQAKKYKALDYWHVPRSITQMRGCLAAGFPFVFGFSVYEEFESSAVASSGIVPLPAHSSRMLGGHAVLAVGYDHAAQRFLVRNSWGSGWGQQGYFWLPYAYLTDSDLSDDFWCIKLEENSQ